MERITNLETMGWNGAFRGMRNPKNSWEKNDTENEAVGPNDMKLAQTLKKAGPEHRKYLRMIHVQFDLVFPRYVWSEFDTYHHNTKNSCSTMHKLLDPKHEIDINDFEPTDDVVTNGILREIILQLNILRSKYLVNQSNETLRKAKMILPESYLQKRTVDTNYEELRTIYHQRKNHRLPEWREFCKELETKLPYFKEFISDEEVDNERS